MPSTQEMLQLITGMQQNAQANLPVVPNNGNPQGANNMPAAMPAQSNGNTGHFYPWMQPSSHMALIKDMLARPLMSSTQPTVTPSTQPAPPAPASIPALPILPNWRGQRRAMMAQDGDMVHKISNGSRIDSPEHEQALMSMLPAMPLRGQGY